MLYSKVALTLKQDASTEWSLGNDQDSWRRASSYQPLFFPINLPLKTI